MMNRNCQQLTTVTHCESQALEQRKLRESSVSRSDVRYTAVVPDGSTEATFLKMKTGAKSESNR